MVTIELTDEEALLFRKFREKQDTFMTLEEAGVFDIRNGKATLNFDANGTLCEVDCVLKLYKRGLAIVPVIVHMV
jgi:hypothetical protein